MAGFSNIFHILVGDDDVRITFSDQRPDNTPDGYGRVPHPPPLRSSLAAEVVMSPATFKQLLDVGGRVMDEHEAKKKPN